MELHGHDTATAIHFYEADYYVFSNFSAFRIWWRSTDFDTAEHAYQWSKFDGASKTLFNIRDAIWRARSAHDAFKIAEANKHLVPDDWSEKRVPVMYSILCQKEGQHEYVHRKLLNSTGRLLVEDSWRDSFWGWGPDRQGKNMLGRLWMFRRQVLHGSDRQIDWDAIMALGAE